MLIARNHSSDEASVGSWVSAMGAVWGSLAAVEERAEQQRASFSAGSGGGVLQRRQGSGAEEGVEAAAAAAAASADELAAEQDVVGQMDGVPATGSSALADGGAGDNSAEQLQVWACGSMLLPYICIVSVAACGVDAMRIAVCCWRRYVRQPSM
jgi:hypothetical protein